MIIFLIKMQKAMANVKEMRDPSAVTHSCPAWEMRRGRGDVVSTHSQGSLVHTCSLFPQPPAK